jgi:GMP synthase (glutamine-hydrolysing)
MNNFIIKSIQKIRNQIGNEKVVLGFSGGVDSSVVLAILHKAIGNNLYCIFIDNGLLRCNEAIEINENIKDNFAINLIQVNAQNKFINELSGITDPEIKRKIIGRLFINIFQEEIKKLNKIKFLAQGTIYPDCIESYAESNGKKNTIKSHHNVGGLPDLASLELVEPLKYLFKDEVRLLGKELGISKKILTRHPFPGPGLGIRIIGEVTQEKCDILRKADEIYLTILKKKNLYNKIWQAYAALLSTKTVGIMGDSRTYEYICLLRAVTSVDGMTANYYDLPHDILSIISRKIINEVPGINRVVYDVTSKPPATIELE